MGFSQGFIRLLTLASNFADVHVQKQMLQIVYLGTTKDCENEGDFLRRGGTLGNKQETQRQVHTALHME